MLEAVDQVAQEREPNLGALPDAHRRAADARRRPSPVVSAAFFWKLLSLEGYHPILDGCARCGAETGPVRRVRPRRGRRAVRGVQPPGGRRVGAETLAVVGQIVGGQLNRVLDDPPTGPVLTEVERLGDRRRSSTTRSVACAAPRCSSAKNRSFGQVDPGATGGSGYDRSFLGQSGSHGARRQPLQAARLRLPLERDLRRLPLDLGLRPARRAAEAQRQGRLVALDGAAARRRRRPRCRDPHGAEGLGGQRPPRRRSPTRSSTAATARSGSGPITCRRRARARTAAPRTRSPRRASST